MTDYSADRKWSDKFIPMIKQIVGPLAMGVAPNENDTKENTDLMVLDAHDMRVACRMRTHGYFRQFGHEVTIRLDRKSGAETEFLKLIKGFGRWFFYGHANEADNDIEHWMVLDLNIFRASLIFDANTARKVDSFDKQNIDGTTSFKVYDMRTFPRSVFVARSPSVILLTDNAA
jgi:hypothetical protein